MAVPGSRLGPKLGPPEMLRGQRGGVYHKTRWGVFHCRPPFFAVSIRVFRPKPADPSRASGEGKDGSDPPFFAAGAARRWGGVPPRVTWGATPSPLAKRGRSRPKSSFQEGSNARPRGANGRADERRDDAARRRVFADRRRHVLVVRVALCSPSMIPWPCSCTATHPISTQRKQVEQFAVYRTRFLGHTFALRGMA